MRRQLALIFQSTRVIYQKNKGSIDRIGFVELQNFMKPENYLKNAEMAMEDDYGMLDGIINNGKAPAAEERP